MTRKAYKPLVEAVNEHSGEIITALNFAKKAAREYQRYPDHEFREQRLNEIDSAIAAVRACNV